MITIYTRASAFRISSLLFLSASALSLFFRSSIHLKCDLRITKIFKISSSSLVLNLVVNKLTNENSLSHSTLVGLILFKHYLTNLRLELNSPPELNESIFCRSPILEIIFSESSKVGGHHIVVVYDCNPVSAQSYPG